MAYDQTAHRLLLMYSGLWQTLQTSRFDLRRIVRNETLVAHAWLPLVLLVLNWEYLPHVGGAERRAIFLGLVVLLRVQTSLLEEGSVMSVCYCLGAGLLACGLYMHQSIGRSARLLVLSLLVGCVNVQPHSLRPAETVTAFESRTLAPVDLKQFLETNLHREVQPWPLRPWDLDLLTLAAFYYHPDLDIADRLQGELHALARDLPPDIKLTFFYDQSLFVRASVRSVWEAILFGLLLSVVILYCFLKHWGSTMTATVVIPVTVLITLIAVRLAGLSFNLMTLGGIAAAIGLVIDDAIVVVEAMYSKMQTGMPHVNAVQYAISEIFPPLVGSTLTPVVVFLPLSFLGGVTGVFFRALALTMVVALLTSLVLAISLTPALAAWLIRGRAHEAPKSATSQIHEGGFLMRRLLSAYEAAVRRALQYSWLTLGLCGLILLFGIGLYRSLDSEFLPSLDEGGFVIDYHTPWGTSLTETNRQLLQAEAILRATPEVESYSRRTGARLALAIAEPNTGDFLVKLKPTRQRTTDEVMAELRGKLHATVPGAHWEFAGILSDLIGDLTWSPRPIEVKVFSPDAAFLQHKAPELEAQLKKITGVVDTFDGLVMTGPSLSLRVRYPDAERFGFTAADVATAVNTAMLGQTASYILEGDRVINIRVRLEAASTARVATLRDLLLRAADGTTVKLSQIADIIEEPGQLELHREDLRQNIAVTARLEGRDLGSAMAEIRTQLSRDPSLSASVLEFGGLYQQQQESFHNLLLVLAMAIFLVFTVLLIEFRSFVEPIAIVFGAVLALFGSVLALLMTSTSLNVVFFLGAIIGVGIVAKNGILLLDVVDELRATGLSLQDAIVRSGQRRLRPVLMTSLAAALGLVPLAYGIGSGADMLKPLAIAVIGALCISVLLSLVATPTVYFLLTRGRGAYDTPITLESEAGDRQH